MKHARASLLVLGLIFAMTRPVVAQEAWRDKVTAFAAKNFKHPAWGYSHSQRDYELARSLAAADHVTLDDDILFAAAYLHDMAAFPKWAENKKDHSDVAAAKIDIVLAGTDFPEAKKNAVRAAIRTHMFYRDPVSPEARYLHDADALEWLGAIGVARDLALVDPKGGRPLPQDALNDLQENRDKVPSRVVTPAGKALIAPRLAEEKAFLDALRRETDGLKTL
jgi:HD superfamily phosphodiesterase